MVYPIVVMIFAFAVLIALVVFLVPVFVGVFKQFGGDLPTITKLTVGLSHAMTGYWWRVHHRRGSAWSASSKWKAHRQGPQACGTRSACGSR